MSEDAATHLMPAATMRASAAKDVRRARREAAAASIEAFALTYLPGHCTLAPSAMHREIMALLEDAAEHRGLRLAVAAPRGHAKSTLVSLAYVLWCVCYGRERFVVLISDTADQAIDLLAHIKGELEGNDRLREDFPDACEKAGVPPLSSRWRRDDITTRNGVRVMALGAEQKLRGRRVGADRPTLIVLDDLENEDLVRSGEQRDARASWLAGAVLKAGSSTTNIVVVGTVLHHDSVLARLVDHAKSPTWTSKRYAAIVHWPARQDLWDRWESIMRHEESFEGSTGPQAARRFVEAHHDEMHEGAQVLWPQLESLEDLMRQRLEGGRESFATEKMNTPSAGDAGVFLAEDITYWDDPSTGEARDVEELLQRRPELSIGGACDPSLGKAGGDDSAIVVLAKDHRTGVMYVLDADIRRRSPQQTIESILELRRLRRMRRCGIETVAFQSMLGDELERRVAESDLDMRIVRITHRAPKQQRIEGLRPLLTTGKLRLSRRHRTLIDQLLAYPTGRHDDGPDALEMAVRSTKQEAMAVELEGAIV